MPLMTRVLQIFRRDVLASEDRLAALEGRVVALEAKLAIAGIGAQQVVTTGSVVGLRRGSTYLDASERAPPEKSVILANHPESWVIEKF